jgi:hypothetical protein
MMSDKQMKALDFLPPKTRGLVELFCFHPFWHPKYRRDFGAAVAILCAIFQVAVFVFLFAEGNREWWPLFAFLAFLIGSVTAFFICSEISIIRLHVSGQRRCLGPLLGVQAGGVALIGGALFLAPVHGSLAGLPDGISLYPFLIGCAAFIGAPLVIWEAVRR